MFYYKFPNPGDAELLRKIERDHSAWERKVGKKDTFCFFLPENSNEWLYYSVQNNRMADELMYVIAPGIETLGPTEISKNVFIKNITNKISVYGSKAWLLKCTKVES